MSMFTNHIKNKTFKECLCLYNYFLLYLKHSFKKINIKKLCITSVTKLLVKIKGVRIFKYKIKESILLPKCIMRNILLKVLFGSIINIQCLYFNLLVIPFTSLIPTFIALFCNLPTTFEVAHECINVLSLVISL